MIRPHLEPWWIAPDGGDPSHDGTAHPTLAPPMATVDAEQRRRVMLDRARGFTPDWRPRPGHDAGSTLVRLLAEQQALVAERLGRLPEKLRVAFLRAAGVQPRLATPARAVVAFTVGAGARRAVRVAQGFKLSAPPIDGEGEPVTFETTRTVFAQPATIGATFARDGETLIPADIDAETPENGFAPFPVRETDGALLIGLDVAPDASVGPRLSIGVRLADRKVRPAPRRDGLALRVGRADRPLIRWEVLDGEQTVPLELVRDETREFSRSGLIELSLPRRWRPAMAAGEDVERRWLIARVIAGRFATRPRINRLWLNAAEVVAVRTLYDEPLEPLSSHVFRLRHTPVQPGSTVIEVDEGGLAGRRRWRAVGDLSQYGPSDRVYTVDPTNGRVRFGDGVHGAALPAKRGALTARRYQVGADSGSGVVEETITTLADSVPYLMGVTNPFPASGGHAPESRADTLFRGPALVRARGRAVSPADYSLLALEAPGADVARAHGVDGHDPTRPGCPLPGVVTVFVIPPDRHGVPPTPSEDDLIAVSRHLARQVVPAGVEVIAAAPRYHTVRIEATIGIDPATDTGTVVSRLLERLDDFLHPLRGGPAGRGWPFGAALAHLDLLTLVDGVEGVEGVARLAMVVDGIRIAPCEDFVVPPYDLLWPVAHEFIPEVAP